MGRFDGFYQSCGMPMTMDPNGGGTEADGSRSALYCSHCYRAGAFLGSFASADEMIAHCRQIFKGQGMPWWKRWFYTSHIRQLKRWQKN